MLEEYTIRERELEILHGQMSEQNGDEHQVRELLASSETEMLELEGRLHALRTQTNEVALYQEKVTQSEQNLITSKIMYFKVQDQAEKCRVLIKEHAQETEKYRKKIGNGQHHRGDADAVHSSGSSNSDSIPESNYVLGVASSEYDELVGKAILRLRVVTFA
ncbi:uncharacterized protein LOC126176066 [Schistocerca cancellata]|uniref:uncharacterized protein LOC126176066 n=1 Tax=Schistocerca cancellata TaxID=274614 RepID=UPI002118D018|nr:uncharacterized protein LOC126176066 [Schistocerca cancellata]